MPTAELTREGEDPTPAPLVAAAVLVDPLAPKPYPRAAMGHVFVRYARPALFLPDANGADRFYDFFASPIRNKNTRRAYYRAACAFSAWCEGRGLRSLAHTSSRCMSPPTSKG